MIFVTPNVTDEKIYKYQLHHFDIAQQNIIFKWVVNTFINVI